MKHPATLLVALLVAIAPCAFADEASDLIESQSPRVEIVFALDTTGSMGGLITAAKAKIWAIANSVATADPTPEIAIGLVGYRDRSDTYVTKVVPLTEDLDAVYRDLMAFQANGGGDTPESVNQALNEAITKHKWDESSGTYRVIFLVGDAPPKMNYQDDVKYKVSCELAAEKDIIINTVQCGNMASTTPIWKEIAELGGGEYFQIAQNGGATHYTTPFDKDIAETSRKLDGTRVYYGSSVVRKQNKKRLAEAEEMMDAAAPSVAAQRAAFNSAKGGSSNFLGSNELIDAVGSGKKELADIKEDQLPKELKKLSPEKRQAYIKEKYAARQQLIKEIQTLNEKRQQHIKEQIKKKNGDKDSFEANVFRSLKKQAGKKNVKLNSIAY